MTLESKSVQSFGFCRCNLSNTLLAITELAFKIIYGTTITVITLLNVTIKGLCLNVMI